MAKIVGTDTDDTLFGAGENDNIWGLGGNDILDGGAGRDFLYGGAGSDVLTSSSGRDELDGGDGDDRMVFTGVGGAARGGAGIDTLVVDLSGTTEDIRFNGRDGHGSIGHDWDNSDYQIYFRDIERLELTTGSGDDFVIDGRGDDFISTGDGADSVGESPPARPGTSLGNDTIDTGAGPDVINDRFGANHLFGGEGIDTIDTSLESVEIDGGEGFDYMQLHDDTRTENITIDFAQEIASTGTIIRNIEFANVYTGSGNDIIIGSDVIALNLFTNAGDDHFEGGGREDAADGGIGNDFLSGGNGNDLLRGASGNDILTGGFGADTLAGGSEADTFVWDEATARLNGGVDHITDFDTVGGDVISLQGFTSSSTGIHDFNSFMAASHDTAGGVFVSFAGDTNGILIENITLAGLSSDDVVFT